MGKPWKELEKKTAEALGGVRINRSNDYGESNVDVIVPWISGLRIDCKYRSSHAHHSLVEEIRRKYCENGDWPILVTKHRGSHREYVTCDLSLFASMLDLLSKVSKDGLNGLARKQKEEGQRMAEDRAGEGLSEGIQTEAEDKEVS